MFEIPDLKIPSFDDIPTLQDHLKPVIAAVLAGAMLQKVDVPAGKEAEYLFEKYLHFQKVI